MCIALGSREPGNGAKGQDEEEADQKTPPARTLSVSSSGILVVEDSTRHIPVSHVDVLSIMDKEIVPVAIVRRRCGVSKGRRCDDAEAWRVILQPS